MDFRTLTMLPIWPRASNISQPPNPFGLAMDGFAASTLAILPPLPSFTRMIVRLFYQNGEAAAAR
jgi:hypothetical protein